MKCWTPLCALASVLAAGLVIGQQPIAEKNPPDKVGAPVQLPSQQESRAKEISDLKETLAQLQEQLKRIESDSKLGLGSLPFVKNAADASLFPETLPAPGQGDGNRESMFRATWKNGLWVGTSDEEFRFHAGGIMQVDFGWNRASQAVQFGDGGIGEMQDGGVFRRATIRLEGTMYSHIEWLAEFDFANSGENDTGTSTQPIGSPSFGEVWVTATQLPVIGNVRVGWLKEPVGFEY